ncbi:MAG: peptidoglycan-binding protein [Candidatus Dojkabacteria bacterium]|nr:MAG: peptidoglycan-binding protein [Candidatus Dojkabacteria bacterium]
MLIDKNAAWVKMLDEAEKTYKVDSALLQAVIMVECRGTGYDRNGRLLIQFEPHWFVKIHNRKNANKLSLKYVNGKYHVYDGKKLVLTNGVELQDEEWEAFNKALKYDAEAAYEATSYGMPQIMGFNHKAAGYSSAEEMFVKFRDGGEEEHIRAFLRFLANTGLMNLLKEMKIADFAYYYNGPAYKRFKYDKRILLFYNNIKAERGEL